jgi:hypothetical protein
MELLISGRKKEDNWIPEMLRALSGRMEEFQGISISLSIRISCYNSTICRT